MTSYEKRFVIDIGAEEGHVLFVVTDTLTNTVREVTHDWADAEQITKNLELGFIHNNGHRFPVTA